MPYSAEFSIQYGSFTVGGSTAREIVDYTIEEHSYEAAAIEFEFITKAANEADFITEINACRDAFRDPRNDITITNGATTRAYNHSDNTALDTNPTIIKDGDPADAGFSRHFRVRIEFGLPADNVGTNFRRYSTINVEYTPSRQRIVTVHATYTAESGGDTTAAFAQYRAEIGAYLLAVVQGVDSSATWETIDEPTVERNETDKVVHATIIAQEVLHDQAIGLLNDDDLVNPQMTIEVEDLAPGDSTGGGIAVGGVSGGAVNQTTQFTSAGNTVTDTSRDSASGQTVTDARPQFIRLTYDVGVDASRTLALKQKWSSAIRSFLINQAKICAWSASATVLIRETPLYEAYPNRLRAVMEFIAYRDSPFEKRISYEESMLPNYVLKPITSKNVYDYYEYPAPALRTARSVITYKIKTNEADPNKLVGTLLARPNSIITNLLSSPESGGGWRLISHRVVSANLKQGRPGAAQPYIAEVEIETVAQFRKRKRPSVANAGGVTGAGIATTGAGGGSVGT